MHPTRKSVSWVSGAMQSAYAVAAPAGVEAASTATAVAFVCCDRMRTARVRAPSAQLLFAAAAPGSPDDEERVTTPEGHAQT